MLPNLLMETEALNSRRVDLAIVGAQKASTTYLKNLLFAHPEIDSHEDLEFTFFRDDEIFSKSFEFADRQFLSKKAGAKKIIIKNVAIGNNEKSLQRLHKHNPQCKIILIMRNPVERAYSSYLMEKRRGGYDREFDHILEVMENPGIYPEEYRMFLEYGIYHRQVELIHKFFPQTLELFLFEDLIEDPQKVCKKIFAGLGLENYKLNLAVDRNRGYTIKNRTFAKVIAWLRRKDNAFKRTFKTMLPDTAFRFIAGKLVSLNDLENEEIMHPATRKELCEFYRGHNLLLQNMTDLPVLKKWN